MEKNACPRDIKEGKSITYDKSTAKTTLNGAFWKEGIVSKRPRRTLSPQFLFTFPCKLIKGKTA